jgi:hypothetical protein
MLGTIILDSFTKTEAKEIAAALDEICSPHDHYAFSSAAIYAFWSVPEQELLYIGLAKDVGKRFRQHLGLITCDFNCCKVRQIEVYFSTKKRIGYSIIVQSTMCSPLTAEDQQVIWEARDDEPGSVDLSDVFQSEENIAIAEAMLIELFEQSGDRLPKWNKIRGYQRGRTNRSFYSELDKLRTVQEKQSKGSGLFGGVVGYDKLWF